MKRTLFVTTLVLLITANQAHAFIFTDLIAKVQRVEMMLQANQYIDQINTYRQEFDKYKKVFDQYYKTFHIVYSRLSSADLNDFNPMNWSRLKDHFITIWKTFD